MKLRDVLHAANEAAATSEPRMEFRFAKVTEGRLGCCGLLPSEGLTVSAMEFAIRETLVFADDAHEVLTAGT
ncbi:MAG TPA: hypothetical protein VH277_02985, partial [Gemmatimonadaceae bacterium]|nr:hypothetical protein [Gemmatimonadaceae bacterium]